MVTSETITVVVPDLPEGLEGENKLEIFLDGFYARMQAGDVLELDLEYTRCRTEFLALKLFALELLALRKEVQLRFLNAPLDVQAALERHRNV